MENVKRNIKVDDYIKNSKAWKLEFEKLREIILECDLIEDLKWKVPCYTFENNNVVLIHGFKEYCAILFIKGSLLKDTQHILVQQTVNVQAGRQIRFTSVEEIKSQKDIILAYLKEAIEIEVSGIGVDYKKNTDFEIPVELQSKFQENPGLKASFEALTPGRQRAYILFFTAPKQSKTRESRIEKYIPEILKGKGLND